MADKNLTVKIAGDDRRLRQTLANSRGQMQRFGSFVKNFGARFGLIGGALAGGAGALTGGLSIKVFADATEEVDRLTKLGKQFGVTTESIQIFKRVATLTGTDLNQLLKGFGELSKSIVQFSRDGSGPGKKVFAELGLSASQLQKAFQAGPVETLTLFGNALKGVENPLKRGALVQELLGARNRQLAVALDEAAQVFGKAQDDFERLGLGLTKEETKSVEDLRDAFARIADDIQNKILKGVAQVAKELLPAAEALERAVEAAIAEGPAAAAQSAGQALREAGASKTAANVLRFLLPPGVGGLSMAALRGAGNLLEVGGAAAAGDVTFATLRQFIARSVEQGFALVNLDEFGRTLGAMIRPTVQNAFSGVPAPGTGTINGRSIAAILAAPGAGLGALPGAGTGTINGRRIADILREGPTPGSLPGGGVPAPGTGTINGRTLRELIVQGRKSQEELEKLNTTSIDILTRAIRDAGGPARAAR